MSQLSVVTLPPEIASSETSVLRRAAADLDLATFGASSLRLLLEAMFELQYELRGVGLAAPQVGFSVRVAVVDEGEHDPLALVNPTILETSAEADELAEGCLSIPGWRGVVQRPTAIRVRNHTVAGQPYDLEAEGFRARVIQHEIDHLDGVLYPDRLSTSHQLFQVDPATRAAAAVSAVYAEAVA